MQDLDPVETQEWLDALESVLDNEGEDRAHYLMTRMGELATRSGLGWRGKHTLVLSREAGSMFFLGELFVDFAWPETPAVSAHCGQCTACMDLCPTQAIVGPYQLDARRCISYLTIEHLEESGAAFS